ncbi:MAG TPA: HAD-IIA family hydrolase [Tepidisphaeraceae bacterium]|nr:HAD-IIA family hydrolase [Tepidisphaeraceae bacterium]
MTTINPAQRAACPAFSRPQTGQVGDSAATKFLQAGHFRRSIAAYQWSDAPSRKLYRRLPLSHKRLTLSPFVPSFDFSSYSAVLLDLDGTLSHEDHALPGAVELVRRLDQLGKKYAVLSNTTASPMEISRQLNGLGMNIPADHIYTAAAAAADYVIEKFGDKARVFNLATKGINELLNGRVEWVETADQKCDIVICGAPANIFASIPRQRLALSLLRSGAELVGICADRVYTSPRGIEIGVGALTNMLSYAANVPAVFTGKPRKFFFDHLCHHLGVRTDQCVLIGDNLESDVAGAKALGMKTILPLTGVTRPEEIKRLPPDRRPNWIVNDLTELL